MVGNLHSLVFITTTFIKAHLFFNAVVAQRSSPKRSQLFFAAAKAIAYLQAVPWLTCTSLPFIA